MSFLTRLFAPEVTDLKFRLTNSEKQCQWFRERAEEAGRERLAVQRKYDAEVKRNREREDRLTNEIRAIAADGRPLPDREPKPAVADVPDKIDTFDEIALRSRAKDYAEQQNPGGEVTQDDVERVYVEMKKNPDEWLRDY